MNKKIKYLEKTLLDIDHQIENEFSIILIIELLEMREEIYDKLANMR